MLLHGEPPPRPIDECHSTMSNAVRRKLLHPRPGCQGICNWGRRPVGGALTRYRAASPGAERACLDRHAEKIGLCLCDLVRQVDMAGTNTAEGAGRHAGERAGDGHHQPGMAERRHRVAGMWTTENGEEDGDPDDGADLAERRVDRASRGKPRSRQVCNGGTAEAGEGEADAGTGEEHSREEARRVRGTGPGHEQEEERAGREEEAAGDCDDSLTETVGEAA